jgi:hypothetical protein
MGDGQDFGVSLRVRNTNIGFLVYDMPSLVKEYQHLEGTCGLSLLRKIVVVFRVKR